MSDSDYSEKRGFVRYVLKARAEVTYLDDGTTYSGLVRDISVGGFFIEIDHGLNHVENNKSVEAHITAEISNADVTLVCRGKIVRITDDGFGVFFKSMSDENKKKLHGIISEVRRLMKEDSAK